MRAYVRTRNRSACEWGLPSIDSAFGPLRIDPHLRYVAGERCLELSVHVFVLWYDKEDRKGY